MQQSIVINQIFVLFLIMAVGVFARKKKMITDEVNKGLSEILLNITFPFMIIASFNYKFSKEMLVQVATIFAVSFVIHGFLLFTSKIVYHKFHPDMKSVLRFTTIFSNCAFMGYPILESLYGKIGIFYGSIFVIPFNLFLWTAGVTLFTGEADAKSFKKALKSPGIIAVALGMILFVFSIQLPSPIHKTFEMIGSMTTPISMLIVGASLADMKVREVFSGFSVYYGSFIRLIGVPLLILIALKLMGAKGIILGISVISVAMPAAANTAVFAEKYNADTALASRCIFVTTILSMFTIPFILMLLNA